MLSEFPTKHASNSPITLVTLKSFVILFFLPSCSVNSLMIKDDWRGVRPRLQLTRLPPAFHQPSLLRRCLKRQERIGGRGDGKLEEGIGERFLFTLIRCQGILALRRYPILKERLFVREEQSNIFKSAIRIMDRSAFFKMVTGHFANAVSPFANERG